MTFRQLKIQHTRFGASHLYLQLDELAVGARQLASVAQLVRAIHQNLRVTGLIPTRSRANKLQSRVLTNFLSRQEKQNISL